MAERCCSLLLIVAQGAPITYLYLRHLIGRLKRKGGLMKFWRLGVTNIFNSCKRALLIDINVEVRSPLYGAMDFFFLSLCVASKLVGWTGIGANLINRDVVDFYELPGLDRRWTEATQSRSYCACLNLRAVRSRIFPNFGLH